MIQRARILNGQLIPVCQDGRHDYVYMYRIADGFNIDSDRSFLFETRTELEFIGKSLTTGNPMNIIKRILIPLVPFKRIK